MNFFILISQKTFPVLRYIFRSNHRMKVIYLLSNSYQSESHMLVRQLYLIR